MPDLDPIVATATQNIAVLIAATGALGVAAMGLVDASKALRGGPSNLGFGGIATALAPFLPKRGQGARSREHLLATLKANWLNGLPLADQKARAKALVHLGLTTDSAAHLAEAAGVDAGKLGALARKVAAGDPPTQDEINTLGEFDVVLAAALDAGYEHADQIYRNGCKALSTAAAVALALCAAWMTSPDAHAQWYFIAVLVGICAVPIAPVAKDLATALQTAVTAMQGARKVVK